MGFKVFWAGEHPQKKRVFHKGVFAKRQKARQWCRNRALSRHSLVIVHPNGHEEPFVWKARRG